MKSGVPGSISLIALLRTAPASAQVAIETPEASLNSIAALDEHAKNEHALDVQDQRTGYDSYQLSELLITSPGQRTEDSGSYAPLPVTAGNKTTEDWASVPRSISVMTREQIEDQGL